MSEPRTHLTISFARSMAELDRERWNELASGQPPFMTWEWLNLLEISGSIQADLGWMPAHMAVLREGLMLAAAPLYLKGHGRGEFVYDQFWAEVAGRLGLSYYPKMVAASPFTPVSGYSFLTDPAEPRRRLLEVMLAGMDRLATANDLSGLHVLFATEEFADELEELGLTAWEHQGFIWENAGYGSFGNFLDIFRAGQRKNIRRERERLAQSGVRVEIVPGGQAPDSWFALMHHYYQDTNEKFGEFSCKYLTEAFFEGLADIFRDRLAFAAATVPGRDDPVGLALLVHHGGDHKGGQLYGRYWGAAEEIPFLHFELCYYAPIQWAIEQGMASFDPGMGGEHKPRRGFTSRVTRSMHRFTDPLMARVFQGNIGRVNALTHDYIEELDQLSALKRG